MRQQKAELTIELMKNFRVVYIFIQFYIFCPSITWQ